MRPSPAEALALACCAPELLDTMRSAHSAYHRRHGLATDERQQTPADLRAHILQLLCEAATDMVALDAEGLQLEYHRLTTMARTVLRHGDTRPVPERIAGEPMIIETRAGAEPNPEAVAATARALTRRLLEQRKELL